MPVPISTTANGNSTASEAIFISNDSIFLPRYSGVRPTIRPATNTATMANTSMPYSPEPTPPKMISPSWISASGTSPPSGVNESCIEFTEPFDAAVVAVAHSAELVTPNRTSLPSMLPSDCSTPSSPRIGLPACSESTHTARKPTNTTVIAARSAQPWRVSPTMRPKV